MPWTPNTAIPGQLSSRSPALAAFSGALHMVHPGDSSNRIWWASTTDGVDWSDHGELPGQLSKGPSALASYGGRLHIVHQGDSSNDLWHSSFDGVRWTTNSRILGESAQSPPALAEYGGLLHCLHNGNGSHDLYHLTFDGSGWTKRAPDAGLGRQRSKGAPALAVHGGLLHMVHQGDSSNRLWHATFDGASWSNNNQIPGQLSKSAAALADFDGLLHLVHLGDSSNHLWHSTLGPGGWESNIAIPYQLSRAAPALAGFAGHLHMVHLGDSSNAIWHSTSDGVLVRTPERRVVIIDLDGLRWDTFAAHLKTARDGGGGLSSTYRFELPDGASDDTVLGDGGQQLNSALAELCLAPGNGMVDVRLARTGYPSFTFPMHGTMFTGTWPGRHGVLGNSFVVRDAAPEWDFHQWASLPRALSLAGFCTDEAGESGAFLDYVWGGFDQVSAGACQNRNRGLNSDLRVPTVFERVEVSGLRTCAIHAFYHGAARPWDSDGKDQWWHYDATELRSVKDVCSDADVDQLEFVDHAMFTKASLLTRFRPSTVRVAPPGPIAATIGHTASVRDGEPRRQWRTAGEQHPDGIPDLIALYAASIDEASHVEGIRNQATYLAWFDHRLARFARDLRAADPDTWDRTIFALVADHGHSAITSAPATDNLPGNEQLVREELLRIRDGDSVADDAIKDLRGASGFLDVNAVLGSSLADDFRAYEQAMNLYVYVRDSRRFDPTEVAQRLLSRAMRTEPFGALVLVGGEYRFLERHATTTVALTDPVARRAVVAQLDVPGVFDDEIARVSLTEADAAAERDLRRRLGTAEAFDLLRIDARVAGCHPDGTRSMPDVILLAPAGGAFSATPSTHGSFGYPTTRIPMVFFGPGMPDGRRTLEGADLVDFTPTILSILGVGVPDDLAGRALLGIDGTTTIPARVPPARRTASLLSLRAVGRPVPSKARLILKPRDVHEATQSDRIPDRIGTHLVNVAALQVPNRRPDVVRGEVLRGFIDLPEGARNLLLSQVTLSLPRVPAWLREVFRMIATRPGYQIDLARSVGTTLSAMDFARLVGGLGHILSNPDGVRGERVPPRLLAGTVLRPVRTSLARDPSDLGTTRRRESEPLDDLEPLETRPPAPSPPAGRTETELVEEAMATLTQLVNSTAIADLAVPGQRCR